MLINKSKLIIVTLMALLFSGASFAADSAATKTQPTPPSPVKLLRDASDNTIVEVKKARQQLEKKGALKPSEPLPLSIIAKIVEAKLIPDVDLVEISHTTLGSAWDKATPEEQRHFMSAYKTLLINTYGVALAKYKDEGVDFYKVRGGYENLDRVQVKSRILQTDGPGIPVEYSLILKKPANQWKVVDMSVEGVSLLESFRTQFASELKQGGMKQLLATLDNHNKTVSQQNNKPTK